MLIAIRKVPLYGLVAGHAVSMTGNVLTLVALPLYVLSKTGSATATGLTGVAATLPVALGGVFGGPLVDRLGHRRASVVADLVGALTVAAVPVLDRTTGLPLWGLLALVLASGLLDTPGQVARTALLPEAAAAAEVPIERAVGTFEAVERGARVLGAPLAGLLVALMGALQVLAVDAASFALSALVVARLVPSTLTVARQEATGYWSTLRTGIGFVARDPLLRALVLLVMVTNMFDSAKSTVLLPVYAARELGGGLALGLLFGASGLGALVGSLAFGALGHRLPSRATFVAGFCLAGGVPVLSMAAGLPLPLLVTTAALAGIGAGAINPTMSLIKLQRVPAGVRASVYGIIGAGTWAAMPLGALLGGIVVDQAGLTTTLLAVGVLYLLTTLTPALGGPWRAMDQPLHPPPRPAPTTTTTTIGPLEDRDRHRLQGPVQD